VKRVRLGTVPVRRRLRPGRRRLPEARADGAEAPAFLRRIAQTVERGRFDFFFLGDALATGIEMQSRYPSQMVRLEPFTMMGSIAATTSSVGLVVTANTTYSEPYHLARMLASLDHLSGGQVAWNVVTGADGRAALNFGRDEHGAVDARYDRAEEFIEVVEELWDSWADDALPREGLSQSLMLRIWSTAEAESREKRGSDAEDIEGDRLTGPCHRGSRRRPL
jgi:N-acetyl-S-(2-succino)cysteine monooxygenase